MNSCQNNRVYIFDMPFELFALIYFHCLSHCNGEIHIIRSIRRSFYLLNSHRIAHGFPPLCSEKYVLTNIFFTSILYSNYTIYPLAKKRRTHETTTPQQPRCHLFKEKLPAACVNGIARDSGLVKRTPRKASALAFLQSFCLFASTHGIPSFAALASFISLLHGTTISKQAIHQRTKQSLVTFFQSVLMHLLSSSATTLVRSQQRLCSSFRRVILEDTTSIALPAHLASVYPGSRNQTGKIFSQLKIHSFFDLCSGNYLSFSLQPFTRNDQSLAREAVSLLQPGDVLIRDLGFFVLSAFSSLSRKGILFLSRLQYGTLLYQAQTQQPISLPKYLRAHGMCDMPVLLGEKEKVPLRLVAIPLPDKIAQQRRRMLRQNRDRRCAPSKKHLFLCGWAVFVTTIPSALWSWKDIAQFYSLRWGIEILFKTWKSYCHFRHVPHKASRWQIEATVYARLIFVTLFQQTHARLLYAQTEKIGCLSMQKLSWFVSTFYWQFAQRFANDPSNALSILQYQCRYEKRKRINFIQRLMNVGLIQKHRPLT
jgi:hypothetical protein